MMENAHKRTYTNNNTNTIYQETEFVLQKQQVSLRFNIFSRCIKESNNFHTNQFLNKFASFAYAGKKNSFRGIKNIYVME